MQTAGEKVDKWAGESVPTLPFSPSPFLTCGLFLLLANCFLSAAILDGYQQDVRNAAELRRRLGIGDHFTFAAGSNVTITTVTTSSNTLVTIAVPGGSGAGGSNFFTITGGLTNLNGSTNASQTLLTGTAGSDFSIITAAGVHTFHLPTASSGARGALSAADWSTFNAKQGAITWTSNGVTMATAPTTVRWDSGITGAVSGATLTLGISSRSGVLYRNVTVPAFTNLNTDISVFTNADLYIAPANALSADDDSLIVVWRGILLPGTNVLQAVLGTSALFNTGSFTNALSTFEIGYEITRTSSTSVHADAWFSFNQIGPTLTAYAASGIRTNLEWGIDHALPLTNLLRIASNRSGAISNNYMKVVREPITF